MRVPVGVGTARGDCTIKHVARGSTPLVSTTGWDYNMYDSAVATSCKNSLQMRGVFLWLNCRKTLYYCPCKRGCTGENVVYENVVYEKSPLLSERAFWIVD